MGLYMTNSCPKSVFGRAQTAGRYIGQVGTEIGWLRPKMQQCIRVSFIWPVLSRTARAGSRIAVSEAGRLI